MLNKKAPRSRKMLFPTLGSLVFAIFGCSQLWERLFLWFLAVPNIGNAHFLRFFSFPKLGTLVFVKSNVSQSWEREVFLFVRHLLHLLIDDERDNSRTNPTRITFWAKRNSPFIPYPHTGVTIIPFSAGLIRPPSSIPTISSGSVDCFF